MYIQSSSKRNSIFCKRKNKYYVIMLHILSIFDIMLHLSTHEEYINKIK